MVTDPPDPLDAEPGRCRAGLEAPLHGRFTTALAALAETVDGRAADEAAVVHRQLRGGCSVPGHKFGPLHCVWCCQPGTVPATVSQLAHGAASDSQPFQADASDFM